MVFDLDLNQNQIFQITIKINLNQNHLICVTSLLIMQAAQKMPPPLNYASGAKNGPP